VRIEIGIERHTISVLRQLPRKSRIIKPVSGLEILTRAYAKIVDA
jgi:hypothetical protein